MGSRIEINDTLQITTAQGFPKQQFSLDAHRAAPVTLDRVQGQVFHFQEKIGARIFQLDPVRVYLVHNIEGKWLFWGKIAIQSQTIQKKYGANGAWVEGDWVTSGSFTFLEIFDPEYQTLFTRRESPPGLSYIDAM